MIPQPATLIHGARRGEGAANMTNATELIASKPPTRAEWIAMANSHLRALRCAFVLVNGSASAMSRLPSKGKADVVSRLGDAANFHRAYAELCEMAERRLLDECLRARRKSLSR
jgi:hypothetical protein